MIGFTGTQRGLSKRQFYHLSKLLDDKVFVVGERQWMHNGDCIGADKEAGEIWLEYGGRIHLHPPINPNKRAFLDADRIEAPLPYLERNHRIVDMSDLLIACPGEDTEIVRSGTWATIRYARKRKVPVTIIFP